MDRDLLTWIALGAVGGPFLIWGCLLVCYYCLREHARRRESPSRASWETQDTNFE